MYKFSIEKLKEVLYEAKINTFAATNKKVSLTDQSSIFSYRAFDKKNRDIYIYDDIYHGNNVEAGTETLSLNMLKIWKNQYYGGVSFTKPVSVKVKKDVWPQVVVAFLKKALMNLPKDFPVRGPKRFCLQEIEFENKIVKGDWCYENSWEPLPLFEEFNDPILCFKGFETITFNGEKIYFHTYHGGVIYNKHYPLKIKGEI